MRSSDSEAPRTAGSAGESTNDDIDFQADRRFAMLYGDRWNGSLGLPGKEVDHYEDT